MSNDFYLRINQSIYDALHRPLMVWPAYSHLGQQYIDDAYSALP
jgi:hypothetical protein